MSKFAKLSISFEDYSLEETLERVPNNFYSNLSKVMSTQYDNIVIDNSVIVQSLENTEWTVKVPLEKNRSTVEELYGEDFPLHYKPEQNEIIDSTSPVELYEILSELPETIDLYVPDYIDQCLEGKKHEINGKLEERYGKLEAADIMPEVEKMKEEIEIALHWETDDLMVLDKMCLNSYSKSALEMSTAKDEDRFIVETANDLEGETLVLAYDSDFVSGDIDAVTPEIASHILIK